MFLYFYLDCSVFLVVCDFTSHTLVSSAAHGPVHVTGRSDVVTDGGTAVILNL